MTRLTTSLMLVLVSIVLAGCTIEDVDPVGTWGFGSKYGAGNCFPVGGDGIGGFKVSDGPNGYIVQNVFPGVQTTASLSCNAAGCSMSTSEFATATGTSLMWSLMLAPDDTITGSGSMNGTNPTCSQALVNVMGRRD